MAVCGATVDHEKVAKTYKTKKNSFFSLFADKKEKLASLVLHLIELTTYFLNNLKDNKSTYGILFVNDFKMVPILLSHTL